LARDGSGRQVARLRLAPGAPPSSPSLARSRRPIHQLARRGRKEDPLRPHARQRPRQGDRVFPRSPPLVAAHPSPPPPLAHPVRPLPLLTRTPPPPLPPPPPNAAPPSAS